MKYGVKHEKHVITFSPSSVRARVLMIPFATSAELVETVLELGENQHHAWGVKELLAANIEVSVSRGYGTRWDRFGQDWRMPDTREYDLIYSNHNRLVRTPIENFLGLKKTPFVSLVYAGERLFAASRHFGIICMTPHAFARFDASQPTRTFYAPWGIDPESALHQRLDATGEFHISTGVTGRDFSTLFSAARLAGEPIVLAARGHRFDDPSKQVRIIDSLLTPWEIRGLYAGACAGLIVLKPDEQKTAGRGLDQYAGIDGRRTSDHQDPHRQPRRRCELRSYRSGNTRRTRGSPSSCFGHGATAGKSGAAIVDGPCGAPNTSGPI